MNLRDQEMCPPPGTTVWVIAEGFIPGQSSGTGRAFESHETACILNAGEQQHTRLDSRANALALLSTIAYGT